MVQLSLSPAPALSSPTSSHTRRYRSPSRRPSRHLQHPRTCRSQRGFSRSGGGSGECSAQRKSCQISPGHSNLYRQRTRQIEYFKALGLLAYLVPRRRVPDQHFVALEIHGRLSPPLARFERLVAPDFGASGFGGGCGGGGEDVGGAVAGLAVLLEGGVGRGGGSEEVGLRRHDCG
ncbi:uncharacterized protein BDZ99DRAFT_166766 [Mytilinidion resinicola]|uniref:Uncharacterized protein n=1 Tax=Mytilinidion resinicola TaxID=574789 RepID=A0A6A6Y4W1_9PEZI|nr:uncharacterized protein BDZ99DRAFT_166766 [Mytilinidion resinicola]KAF2803553.1 hypothetical protein BDZ99DRAFT_166766 [Mytilinidion resinicola]